MRLFSALFLSVIFSTNCFAQNLFEQLSPYNGPLREASGIVAAGTGLAGSTGIAIGAGSITIDVPGEVRQVILFWNGFVDFPAAPIDETILLNGTQDVQGTIIGGPTNIFGNVASVTLRADITALNLISPGTNTLTLSDANFDRVTNGAGILVLYDDGTDFRDIQVREGQDYAFIFAPAGPLNVAVAQRFDFEAAPHDRVVDLDLFFASVAGSFSGFGPERPNSIEVSIGGNIEIFSDRLNSVDGDEWDSLQLTFTVPAGVDFFTVQPFSRDDFNTGNDPASFTWVGAFSAIQNPDFCVDDPRKTEPGVCGCGIPDVDTDGDGVFNCNEQCVDDGSKTEPGICGCGVSDVDIDQDGIADCIDICEQDPLKSEPGICGCGVSDIDSDGDGTVDCQDLCELDDQKIEAGVCGCGFSDLDTDGDGFADCDELCIEDPLKTSPGSCGCGIAEDDPSCNPVICTEENFGLDTLAIDSNSDAAHQATEAALDQVRSALQAQGSNIPQKRINRIITAMDELHAGEQGNWILAYVVLPQSQVSCDGINVECASTDLTVTKDQIIENQRAYRKQILPKIRRLARRISNSATKAEVDNYLRVTKKALRKREKRQRETIQEIPDTFVSSCSS